VILSTSAPWSLGHPITPSLGHSKQLPTCRLARLLAPIASFPPTAPGGIALLGEKGRHAAALLKNEVELADPGGVISLPP